MFEELIKKAVEKAMQEANRIKEEENNSLMSEIESFHRNKAIDNALKNNDREAFIALMKKTPVATDANKKHIN